jgi:branched-chain amino acid transport system substrate-binding protein
MKKLIVHGVFAVGLALLALSAVEAWAADGPPPIRIGEINSYTGPAAVFTASYRRGFDMAVDEVNKAGGVLGRPLQIIYRDDTFSPAEGVRQAKELIDNEKVDLLAGTFFSPVALAVATVANQSKTFFLAAEALSDKLTWQQGSRYVFRIRNPTYELVNMIASKAAALPCTRWGILSTPDDASRDTVENFKAFLTRLKPGVTFAGTQIVPPGQSNPGSAIDGLERMKVECVFNTLFGADLFAVVREGNTRGFFDDVKVVSTLAGEPEYLDPLKTDTPVGWWVTGYPWSADDRPAHKKFRDNFEARYHDYPRMGALIAYVTVKALAAGIAKAGSTDTEKLITAFKGLQFDTPVGMLTMRDDHQSTLGSWVGQLALKDGKGVMVDWTYLDGADYLPPLDVAMKMRPAGSND